MILTACIENARDADPALVTGRVAVVIDVLRASTTIVTALAAGARAVIPVASVEAARRLAARDNAAILGGERDGLAPPGFTLGNSPLEYTRDAVGGRTVVLTTTNGTLAIERCGDASAVIVCAFTNLRAVRCWLERCGEPAVLVCAGGPSGPGEEDVLCAGVLAHELGGKGPGLWEARARAATEPDIATVLRESRHGRYLASLGLEADVAYCARRDLADLVPVLTPHGELVAERGANACSV